MATRLVLRCFTVIAAAFASVLAPCLASVCLAQDLLPEQQLTEKIIRSVAGYASAISCPDGVMIEPEQIAALQEFKTAGDRFKAKYAVLWTGDIGCSGGSGSSRTNISIVTIGANDSCIVDPLRSSPAVQFDSPVRYIEKIISHTRDSLVLEGKEYGENDPNCCPSIPRRFTLREDQNGNWKIVERKP